MAQPRLALRVVQLAFWAALVFTFVAAVMPARQAPQLFAWDKAEHFAAFFTLTVLGAAAFPRRSIALLALLLSAFGGFVEFVQALPIVGRDADVRDWVADSVAVGAALLALALIRWRMCFGRAER